jgi:hypothetical protein
VNNINSIFRPEFTRLLLSQLRDRQMDTGAMFGRPDGLSKPAQPAPPPPSGTSWEPSPAALQLVNIAARNHETPPKIHIEVRATEPVEIAKEMRSALEGSGMSYHARLADAVETGKPLQAVQPPPPPPVGGHPFDSAVMAALTGQVHTVLNTPFGRAALIWHRSEEEAQPPRTGYVGKIHSASIAIEHPQLGPIVADLDLVQQDLAVAVRCTEASAGIIKERLPALVQALWGVGTIPFVIVAYLPHE